MSYVIKNTALNAGKSDEEDLALESFGGHRQALASSAPGAREALSDLLRQGQSPNTRRSYRSAMEYWQAWHLARFGSPLPFPTAVDTVLIFILDHAGRVSPEGVRTEMPAVTRQHMRAQGYPCIELPSLSTLTHRVAVLSRMHQACAKTSPCATPEVRSALAAARRGQARRGGPASNPQAALGRSELEQMLATCTDGLRGQRDRAMLLFAWASGGRRRSEVVSATVEQLVPQVGGGYVFWQGASKTNPQGGAHNSARPVLGRAADALTTWLEASGIRTGAIFRRIRRGGIVGEPLQPSAVRDVVIRRSALAGLDAHFSAHSLRSGFVTEAARQGISMGDTMAMTGHASPASVLRYYRAPQAVQNPAALLLDEGSGDQGPPK